MNRVFRVVNGLAACIQLFGDVKQLAGEFKSNLRRKSIMDQPEYKPNLRRKSIGDQPEYKPLFTDEMIKKVYLNPEMKLSNYGHFIIADSRYIAVAAVEGNTPASRKSAVLEFKENSAMSIDDIQQLLTAYPKATLIVNDSGEGKLLGQLLKKNGIWYMPMYWGGSCFHNDNRKQYVNKRAQAYVGLHRAVEQENFKICQLHNKEKVLKEFSSIQYSVGEDSRFKIMPVSKMREMGHEAPDIADLFAQVFLENTAYSLELNTPDFPSTANNTQSD